MALHAVRKITVREILKGKPEREMIDVGDGKTESRVKEQDFALLYGQAHSIETGQSQFGPYHIFIGRFEARRIKDGEVFQSTRAIFPQIAEDIAVQHFMDAKREDETAMVDMAFVIGAEYDARGTEGYKFTVKPVATGNERVDPLAALREAMLPALKTVLVENNAAQLLQLSDHRVNSDGTEEHKARSGKQKETTAS